MQNTETPRNKHLVQVQRYLDTARISEVTEGSTHTGGSRIVLADGPDEITIRRGNDGRWRYTYQSTYGNGSHIWSGDVRDPNGSGQYDASGYRIVDPDIVARLEEILRVRNVK